MNVLNHRKSLSAAAQRWLSVVALLMQVTTSTGIPLSRANKPAIDQFLFPCQGGTCGCRTATECWQDCCCTTPLERLAWAYRHGVRAPTFLLPKSTATGQAESDEVALCYQPTIGAAQPNGQTAKPKPKTERATWVPVVHARRCQGKIFSQLLNGRLFLPPKIVQMVSDRSVQGFLITISPLAETVFRSPPTPPPQAQLG